MTFRFRRIIVALALLLALVAAGCSSSGDNVGAAAEPTVDQATATPAAEPTADDAAEPEPEPTEAPVAPTATPEPPPTPTPEPVVPALPDTPASVVATDAYTFDGGVPDPTLLPAQPGEVTVRWYRAGVVYAVVYEGLDATADACPGNSALTGNGFEFVSNAELPNAACPGFATRIENGPTQGVQICDGLVGYLTLIPSDTVGTFFASIEKPVPDIGGVGLTSTVAITDPSTVPEVDLAALAC